MIKLFSLKQQKAAAEAAAAASATTTDGDGANAVAAPAAGTAAPANGKRTTAAQIRLQKDLSELDMPRTMSMEFPDANDILNFRLTIRPDEGLYTGGAFVFTFKFKPQYPHEPPKVLCTQKIYHPNIDLEGNVCLNILREDWKPVLNLQAIVIGLQFLFLEPNPDDPLNKDAARELRQNRKNFERLVMTSMHGGMVGGVKFDNVAIGK